MYQIFKRKPVQSRLRPRMQCYLYIDCFQLRNGKQSAITRCNFQDDRREECKCARNLVAIQFSLHPGRKLNVYLLLKECSELSFW